MKALAIALILVALVGCASGPEPTPTTGDAQTVGSPHQDATPAAASPPNGLPDCGGPPDPTDVLRVEPCDQTPPSHDNPSYGRVSLCYWFTNVPGVVGQRVSQVVDCYPSASSVIQTWPNPYPAGIKPADKASYTCPAACPTDASSN